MSPCEKMRHLILEGEPHELRGEGGSPLAVHVRMCPRCARAATRVLDETERLDAFLTRDPTGAQVDAVLERAGRAASPSTARAASDAPPAARPRSPSRRWAVLAAAAAVGALLLLPGRSLPPPGPELLGPGARRLPTVEAMTGQRVAVVETDNPEITVLWFF